MSNTVKSVKDKLKGLQRPRRAFRLNTRGDLRAQIELLDAELVTLRNREKDRPASSMRITDTSDSQALAARIQGLQDEMEESWLDLEVETQRYADWEEFKRKNPPREGNEVDANAGFNFDKLVFEFVPKCVVEPELDAEDWEAIFDYCSPADLRNLGSTVYALHQIGTDIPLSRAASAVMRQSDDASELQGPGESASDASAGGSPPNSTSTTTQPEISPEAP